MSKGRGTEEEEERQWRGGIREGIRREGVEWE